MEVKLKVLVGKNAGQELLIPGPKFFVGRADDCQLRPRSDLISRHHCAILVEEGFLAVRDFGSKNGTLINGERVVGERELKPGDKLTIGPLEFEVMISAPAAAKKRPKVESVKEAASRAAEGVAEGSNDDMDVSQWLTDKDSKVGTAETRVINVNETGEIDMGGASETHSDMDAAATQTTANEMSETIAGKPADKTKKQPGKLPAVPRNNAADSRTAAADVLSKFFKRR